jgi:REP element-mobilizing transposase RayT
MIIKLSLHYFPSILVDIVFCLKILLLAEIRKVLFKIAKEKDCEALNEWIKPCENHLHWSATSTYDGNGLVIWAKFKSFLQHIVNIHSGHSDPLFDKCAHGSNIPARKWLTIGM